MKNEKLISFKSKNNKLGNKNFMEQAQMALKVVCHFSKQQQYGSAPR